jgi:hypothetical protein
MATNGQDATTTSKDYGVHDTAIRGSNETVKPKRQQAAERQRLYRDQKRQVSDNEETLKKRQQAAERKRLYRERKRQQQNIRDEQVTTPPHTEQQEGKAAAATCVHQVGEPPAKRLKLHACENDIQGVNNNNETTINTRQNEETLNKKRQAAERMRLYRDRKRQQQSKSSVISDDELTTPPHIDQPHEPTGKPTIRQLCATTRGSRHFVPPSF